VPRLDELQVGQSAVISRISGDPALVQRLYEFGLLEGEAVELLGFAPMGDPLEIRINNTRLSLRQREAANVLVDLS
jgi:ferrous iron transport protein A